MFGFSAYWFKTTEFSLNCRTVRHQSCNRIYTWPLSVATDLPAVLAILLVNQAVNIIQNRFWLHLSCNYVLLWRFHNFVVPHNPLKFCTTHWFSYLETYVSMKPQTIELLSGILSWSISWSSAACPWTSLGVTISCYRSIQ